MLFEVVEGNRAEVSSLIAKLFVCLQPMTATVATVVVSMAMAARVRKIPNMPVEQKRPFELGRLLDVKLKPLLIVPSPRPSRSLRSNPWAPLHLHHLCQRLTVIVQAHNHGSY